MHEEYSILKFYITDNNFIGLNPDCKELSIQMIKFVFDRLNKVPKSILPTGDAQGIRIKYIHRNNVSYIEVYKYYINVETNNEKMSNCIKNYFRHIERFLWKLIN